MKIAGPRHTDKQITPDVITSIDRQIERYLIVRVLICGIVAVATGVPIALMGVDNAAVLGLVAGVLNVVPYIGPVSGVVVVTLAAFLQFKTVAMTAGGAALAVAVLEGQRRHAAAREPRGGTEHRRCSSACWSSDGCGTCGGCCLPSLSWWR